MRRLRRTPAGTTVPVFANPSGRRWRWVRAVLLSLLVVAVASAVVAVPRVLAPPALAGAAAPGGPTTEEVGDDAPVFGPGPLGRAVRPLRVDGGTHGPERFPGQVGPHATG